MWVILNNGAGGFAPPLTFNLSEIPTSVTTGDFNSDGKTDVVIAVVQLDGNITTDALLFLNDGTGGFGQPREIRPGPGFSPRGSNKIRAVDLDKDGKLDLVSGSSMVTTYRGDGAGGFTFQPISDTDFGFSPAGAVGDFNGDGYPDILAVAAGASVEDLVVYLNDGTGRFGAPVRTPTRQRVFTTQAAIAEDFDGDGKTDVVLRTFEQRNDSSRATGFRLFPATTGGRFSGPIIFQPSIAPIAMAAGDFNSDGAPDIVSVSLSGSLTILSAQGGGFNAPRGFDFSPPGAFALQFSLTDLKSGDLNGDGALDLVIAALGLSDPVIMFGNGHGTFSDSVPINSGVPGGVPIAIELRDFNNDGKPDLALLNSSTNNIVVLLGDGRGGFTPSATIGGALAVARGFASADFNNDGNLDLVFSAQSSGFELYLGNGQGGFTQSATGIGGNLVFNSVFTTGDFNGDGIADLAFFDGFQVPTNNGFIISILIGDGRGGFAEPSNVMVQEALGHSERG
jgi:VCBS repeat protein/FG-GAP repeat protein